MLVEDRSKVIFKKVDNKLYYKQYLNIITRFRSIWRLSKLETDNIPPISYLQTTSSSIRNPVKYMSRNLLFYARFYVLDKLRCKVSRNIKDL